MQPAYTSTFTSGDHAAGADRNAYANPYHCSDAYSHAHSGADYAYAYAYAHPNTRADHPYG